MKRLSIARKFYPRLRYIRINISKLLAALLQVGMLQSSLVQSTGLPVVMAGLVGVAGTAHAASSTGAVINRGTNSVVNNGDTYTNTVVNVDGQLAVSSGGKTSNTNLYGAEQVFRGGSAVSTQIQSTGLQAVYSGGSAIGAQVVGVQRLDRATAINTTISNGGWQLVTSSAIATNTVILNGGEQTVNSAGTASLTSIDAGGQLTINEGGTATSTSIEGGQQNISSGGLATSTTIIAGQQNISSGGMANSTVISGGAFQIISAGGIASNTAVNYNGQQIISSGGTASNTTINVGGQQNISAGGMANSTVISAGASQIISAGGTASNTTINTSGQQIISSGGMASNTFIDNRGQQIISTGGTANGTTFGVSGSQIISSGGTANGALVTSTGTQVVSNGGLANSTVVSSAGVQQINNGGQASNTTLSNGAQQIVSNGGSATSTQVLDGGVQTVYGVAFSQGEANDTQISSGGRQNVEAGGSANNTRIYSGGQQNLNNSLDTSTIVYSRYNNLFTASQGITGSFSEGVYRGRKFSLETNSTGGIDLVTGDINASNDGFAKLNALLGGGQAQASLNQSQSSLNLIRERMERMQGSAYYGTDDNNQVWFSPSPYAHIGRNSGQGSVRDSAYEQKGGGIAFGIDKAITTERRIGAAVIINNSQIDGKDHSLKSSINNTGVDLAVYGHQSLQDDLTLSVIAKSGYTRAKSSRIDDTELPVRAKSSQDIWHLNLAAELVKSIVRDQLTLSPVLGLEYGSAWVSGYQESGAGYYSLNTERQQAESLIASVGSRVRYQLNDKAQLLGYASVGYDALARASHLLASTEDHRFSVTSADPGNIVTRLGLAYEWRPKAGNYLRANYDYQGRDKGYRDNMLRLDWIVVW